MIRILRSLAIVALVVSGLVLPSGVASAGALDVTCAGTQTVTYDPGLVLQPSTESIHFDNIFAPCVSATVPDLISGVSIGTATRTASCLDIAEPDSALLTFTWNTGQTSLFSYNRTVTTVGGTSVVTLTGVITSGLFAGDTAINITTGPAIDLLDCLQSPGVTSRSGVIALTITGS